ncbi:MAG: hypothetical protein PHU85_17055 [Phycisphaerae bacterium]|jgi:hypothetical protein|nr:hypothetical protein [Phycisphaerae bacterium]
MALHEAVGAVRATSAVVARVQYRAGAFVPAQALAEPFPVPTLWDYERGGDFESAMRAWAQDAQRWDAEHMTRIMRDLARLGQEKSSDWVDA